MRIFNLIMKFAEELGRILVGGWRHIIRTETFFYFFLFILIFPNMILCYTEPLSLMSKVCNVLLPFGVYYVVMTCSRNFGKTFWILLPFLFLGAFQIVLLFLFGQSVIAVDMFLNLVTTNSGEVMELLDNLTPAIAFVILLYVPALIFATVSIIKKRKLSAVFLSRQRPRALLALLMGILALGITYPVEKNYKMTTDLYPVNVCYNVLLAFQRDAKTHNYYRTSHDFTYRAKASHPSKECEVYVMVIGETARSQNWSLNGYTRPTNPELGKVRGLTSFTQAYTESNTTHKSVPMLLSPITAHDFDSIYYRKSIITAFKEAGFRTAFFSNQSYNNSFIDFFGKEADTWCFLKEQPDNTDRIVYDCELLELVSRELECGDRKLFIVLHTYGSHFNYRERYPAGMAFFKPDAPIDANAGNRNPLLNAYDNTIRYTDYFLARLIGLLDEADIHTALLYASDHGEDIYDDDRHFFLHASPIPSGYQLHVPFLVWMSDKYQHSFPAALKAVQANQTKHVSSSTSFFHTMLELGGIQTAYFKDSLSVTSPLYRESPGVYLNDHNKPCPQDKELFFTGKYTGSSQEMQFKR